VVSLDVSVAHKDGRLAATIKHFFFFIGLIREKNNFVHMRDSALILLVIQTLPSSISLQVFFYLYNKPLLNYENLL
jgi:hypothetical protein